MTEQVQATDIALAEYKEVLAQFRALTDIRFKLLAFLPLGTVAAVVYAKNSLLTTQPAVAAFAFIATVCIATYNKRNDQLYDELVARAAELERTGLRVRHGTFSDRPARWLRYYGLPVEHRWPVGLLYAASAALWAHLFVHSLSEALGCPAGSALALTLRLLAPALVVLCWLRLRGMESERKRELEEVLAILKTKLVTNEASGPNDLWEVVKAIATEERLLGVDEKTASRRVKHNWDAYAASRDVRAASALLAAVTDLPGRWIEDRWTGRR